MKRQAPWKSGASEQEKAHARVPGTHRSNGNVSPTSAMRSVEMGSRPATASTMVASRGTSNTQHQHLRSNMHHEGGVGESTQKDPGNSPVRPTHQKHARGLATILAGCRREQTGAGGHGIVRSYIHSNGGEPGEHRRTCMGRRAAWARPRGRPRPGVLDRRRQGDGGLSQQRGVRLHGSRGLACEARAKAGQESGIAESQQPRNTRAGSRAPDGFRPVCDTHGACWTMRAGVTAWFTREQQRHTGHTPVTFIRLPPYACPAAACPHEVTHPFAPQNDTVPSARFLRVRRFRRFWIPRRLDAARQQLRSQPAGQPASRGGHPEHRSRGHGVRSSRSVHPPARALPHTPRPGCATAAPPDCKCGCAVSVRRVSQAFVAGGLLRTGIARPRRVFAPAQGHTALLARNMC